MKLYNMSFTFLERGSNTGGCYGNFSKTVVEGQPDEYATSIGMRDSIGILVEASQVTWAYTEGDVTYFSTNVSSHDGTTQDVKMTIGNFTNHDTSPTLLVDTMLQQSWPEPIRDWFGIDANKLGITAEFQKDEGGWGDVYSATMAFDQDGTFWRRLFANMTTSGDFDDMSHEHSMALDISKSSTGAGIPMRGCNMTINSTKSWHGTASRQHQDKIYHLYGLMYTDQVPWHKCIDNLSTTH